ncbi:fibronectin type III domain-containing protein [Streptomyces sp. NPDC046887]|uniref:fibronectin type III domain-containing protein n=1 Tax=Streptomyces sp. NPDC046887 TaxID=3155472 RepID=UPI0033DD3EF2
MLVAATESAGAQGRAAAPARICATHATPAAVAHGRQGPVTLSVGCADEAREDLRALAKSGDDLVAVFDFTDGEQVRELTRDVVERSRADRSAGLTLGESFIRFAQENSVGIYPPSEGGPEYDGELFAVGDSLVMVSPAGGLRAEANWWQKTIAALAATALMAVASAACLLAFNVGAPAAGPVCAAVGGAVMGLFNELFNAAFDGRSLGDGDVWAEAVAMAVMGALAGTGLGSAAAKFATEGAPTMVARLQTGLRDLATRVRNWGNPLEYIAHSLEGWGPRLAEALARAQEGVRDTPRKVMVVGDSMTQGAEGDWTWRYRLWQWFRSQHIDVDFVGPYRGTKTPNAPVAPSRPPLPGEAPGSSLDDPPVLGAYARGVSPDFDSDHFAVWGRQVAQDKKLIGRMVAQYQPDLILVGLGFNDMGWFVSGAQGTLDSMKELIDHARDARPGVRFAVANVPQRSFIEGRQDLPVTTADYNDRLGKAVSSWSTRLSPVELVDWAGAYDCGPAGCPAGYDGLHPNALGEFQIARAFELTLHQHFGIGTFVPDIPASPPARPAPAVPGPVAESVPTGIKVTWRPVFGARGYTVRSRLVGSAQWSEIPVATNRFDTTWTADGLNWEYQVRTDNAGDGRSAWSPTVSAVAHPRTAAPPEKIVTRATVTGVDVSWQPAKGPHTEHIDRYEVITWDRDSPGAFLESKAVRGTSLHVDGLKAGHRYLVAVVTWNDVGGGLPGGGRPVTVGAGTPPAPTDLTIRSVDPVTVQLNWKGSREAAGYRVWIRDNYRGGGFTADEVISDTPERGITFLFPGNWNYDFCVTAVNGAAESGRSNCVALSKPPPTDPIEPPSTGRPPTTGKSPSAKQTPAQTGAAGLSPALGELLRLRAHSAPSAMADIPAG